MNVYLDIVFSIIIGSMLLLMILAYNFDMVETSSINNMYFAIQKNGFDLQEILRYDFRKIGLGVPDTSAVLSIADSTQVKFKTDLDLDGSINEIHYYLGDLSSADFTENPNDKLLYRKVDSNPPETYSIGLIDFNFTYYDENGGSTIILDDIRQLEYNYYLESTFGYNGEYPGMFIRGRINLKNLD